MVRPQFALPGTFQPMLVLVQLTRTPPAKKPLGRTSWLEELKEECVVEQVWAQFVFDVVGFVEDAHVAEPGRYEGVFGF